MDWPEQAPTSVSHSSRVVHRDSDDHEVLVVFAAAAWHMSSACGMFADARGTDCCTLLPVAVRLQLRANCRCDSGGSKKPVATVPQLQCNCLRAKTSTVKLHSQGRYVCVLNARQQF